MKKYIFTTALATSLLIISCADNEVVGNVIPDSQKEMISFSLSDGASQTRAGFTGANTHIVMRIQSDARTGSSSSSTKYTRTTATAIKNHSTELTAFSKVEFQDGDRRFWDDAHGRYSLLSVYAVAVPNGDNTIMNDAKLLTSLVTTGDGSSDSKKWGTNATNTIAWKVTTTAQTKDADYTPGESATYTPNSTIDKEDLVYSNNIQKTGKDGIYRCINGTYTPDNTGAKTHKNGRMLFYQDDVTVEDNNGTEVGTIPAPTEASGHFDKGHLVFNHALTRLTIHLKAGTGFDGKPFAFKTNTNVKVIKVPTVGTLDIATGNWTVTSNETIDKIATITPKNGFQHSLTSQFLPGYTFNSTGDGASANVLEFTIDDNTYYITQSMIFQALNDKANDTTNPNGLDKNATSYTMEQGKNYMLEITVNKTAIDEITATLIEWADVRAENIDATNSYITISTETMGTQSKACNHFDLYRLDAGHNDIYANPDGSDAPTLTNWGGNYTDKAENLVVTSTSGVWRTEWFWESNKRFYHFRTVDKGIELLNTGTDDDDTFNVYSGPVAGDFSEGNISTAINDKKYNDYHWGAPMKSGADLTYNTKQNTESEKNEGYSQSLYCAIGSTKDQINIIEQHMMATVHFVIHTGKKADGTSATNTAVSLLGAGDKGTRVTLTNFAGKGTVKVGNGFITPSETMVSSDIPVPGASSINYSSSSPYTLSSLVTTSDGFFETESTVTKAYSYRVVPQALYRGTKSDIENETVLSNFIGLTIVTPDDNQYYVIKKLYGVKGTVSQNGSKNEHDVTSGYATITRWYPGYDYTYHIYLNKTGIEAITCTVVDWVKVEGNIGDVNLES